MKWLKRWKTQTRPLAVIGPGFSTANVDDDAGGILARSFVHAPLRRIPFWEILYAVIRPSILRGFRPGFFSPVGES
jgi:hypothetical protein